MSVKRLIWSTLCVSLVLEAALIASGLNSIFAEEGFGLNVGSLGPMEVQFHGNMYPAIGWLVIVAVALVIAVAAYNRYYNILATVAGGALVVGSLFQTSCPTRRRSSGHGERV